MQREANAYQWDIANAAQSVQRFTHGRVPTDYLDNELLRAAVERKFGIADEAISELVRYFADYRSKIR
jgi:uncharacterized protein with HEPN domain